MNTELSKKLATIGITLVITSSIIGAVAYVFNG
jgi:hypothetical protein